MLNTTFENFEELLYVKEDNKATMDALQRGEIENITFDNKYPIDKLVNYGLEKGFLKDIWKSFPDPRKKFDIPIEMIGVAHVLQRLDDKHSLISAPYMLNSSSIMAKLGYNAEVLEKGFNDQAKYPRETPFHGEVLKHILLAVKGNDIVKWFNQQRPIWEKEGVGKTRCYLMDGMKIHVPAHLYQEYAGATCVKNEKGEMEYGYKAVWLYELHDKKGIIVSLKIAGINVHDHKLGQELVNAFDFDKDAVLIMDRGFIDAKWIGKLKQEKEIDIFIPLRKNMEATVSAVAWADANNPWQPHPTRKKQFICEVKNEDIGWLDCPVEVTGALVRFNNKKGEIENILFVTTKPYQSAKKILETYDLRTEIEEMHRQLKCYQGMEKLLSKKYANVIFRIITGVIAYNLLTLFLNSENCDTFEEFTVKTLREKRRFEKNPKVIIYTQTTFMILKQFDFLPLILEFEKPIQKKLAKFFRRLEKK